MLETIFVGGRGVHAPCPIQLSNSPRDERPGPRVVLAKARTHTHGSSWLRELGLPAFFSNRQRWKWVSGQARDDTGFCFSDSSDSTIKKPAGYTSAFSRQILPELCADGLSPSKARGRRESRVRAAPAVSRAIVIGKNAHEHTGSAEAFRPSLRNGFTAYSVLSPVTGLSCHRRFARLHAKLDASVGAPGPHDFTVRVSHARQSWLSRPPHLTARS